MKPTIAIFTERTGHPVADDPNETKMTFEKYLDMFWGEDVKDFSGFLAGESEIIGDCIRSRNKEGLLTSLEETISRAAGLMAQVARMGGDLDE